MRYRQLALTGIFIGLSFLLTACGDNGYRNDLPAWDYSQAPQEAAEQGPAQIATAQTVANTHSPERQVADPYAADPYDKISYRDFNAENNRAPARQNYNDTQTPYSPKSVRVAMLLPLSGPQASLGQAMLQTAQMALFDVGQSYFELLPYDTQGTGDGARIATTAAIDDDVQLILGPVFANSVRAAKSVVRYHNVNMISFSTDWSVTSSNVFIMGFLPFDQIERIVTYAVDNDIKRIAAIAPQTTYGRAIMSAYQTLAQQMGIETVDILSFDPQNPNLSPDIRAFTKYDEREEEAILLAESINSQSTQPAEPLSKAQVEQQIDAIKAEMEPPFDATLIIAGGKSALTISNLISHYDLPPTKVKRLGIGLFDDLSLANEFALRDAWFSAPSPQARQEFDQRYKSLYGSTPPRLSSLAYDATALAAILAQTGLAENGRPAFNRRSITNPNGFSGVDGIFRFLDNGTVERSLSILSFGRNSIVEIDPARGTFQR